MLLGSHHVSWDSVGFHPRPRAPVEALAFAGTRGARRTIEPMIAALRSTGFDDFGIPDIANPSADANEWGRLHRLLALPRQIPPSIDHLLR